MRVFYIVVRQRKRTDMPYWNEKRGVIFVDANTVLHELTADVKDRINYLVYKDIHRKEEITVLDL